MLIVLLTQLLFACSTMQSSSENTEDKVGDLPSKKVDSQEPINEESELPTSNPYQVQQLAQQELIPQATKAEFDKAVSFIEAKQYQQANDILDKIIKTQPHLSGTYVNKAMIAKELGELVKAQQLLAKAISVNKLNLYAHHLRGQIYRLQGNFTLAEQSYLAALSIWPNYREAQLSLAILLELYRGRLVEAHQYYQRYLALNTKDKEVKQWLAGLEIKMKRAGVNIPEPLLSRSYND